MIWADRTALAIYGLFCLLLLFFYVHGDMEGLGGLLAAIVWSGFYWALPLWLALRLIDFMLFRRLRHYG